MILISIYLNYCPFSVINLLVTVILDIYHSLTVGIPTWRLPVPDNILQILVKLKFKVDFHPMDGKQLGYQYSTNQGKTALPSQSKSKLGRRINKSSSSKKPQWLSSWSSKRNHADGLSWSLEYKLSPKARVHAHILTGNLSLNINLAYFAKVK